jgi:hypothetical protein
MQSVSHQTLRRCDGRTIGFDTLYNACAAGHYCGVRLVEGKREPRKRYSLQELQQNALKRPSARELAGQSPH